MLISVLSHQIYTCGLNSNVWLRKLNSALLSSLCLSYMGLHLGLGGKAQGVYPYQTPEMSHVQMKQNCCNDHVQSGATIVSNAGRHAYCSLCMN